MSRNGTIWTAVFYISVHTETLASMYTEVGCGHVNSPRAAGASRVLPAPPTPTPPGQALILL